MSHQKVKSSGEKRTLLEVVLISSWIAAYAGVLVAFRAAKIVESALSARSVRAAKGRKRKRHTTVQGRARRRRELKF